MIKIELEKSLVAAPTIGALTKLPILSFLFPIVVVIIFFFGPSLHLYETFEFQRKSSLSNSDSRSSRLTAMGGNECGCGGGCLCTGAVHTNIDTDFVP
jgi:hypothetical protein